MLLRPVGFSRPYQETCAFFAKSMVKILYPVLGADEDIQCDADHQRLGGNPWDRQGHRARQETLGRSITFGQIMATGLLVVLRNVIQDKVSGIHAETSDTTQGRLRRDANRTGAPIASRLETERSERSDRPSLRAATERNCDRKG